MTKRNVLIFPAGTEIALEILNALKYSKFVKLFGGTSTDDHSEFVFKNLIKGFPFVNEEGFLDFLNCVIKKYKIDCIYPAHDSVSLFLSKNASKIDAQVIIADELTTGICRSKYKTYKFLANKYYVPKIFNNIDEVKTYPVFVKPDVGQGSFGAAVINNRNEFDIAFAKDSSIIICEYLPGKEFTVDCFTDRNGKLLVIKPRERLRIKTGIAVRSSSVKLDKEVENIANNLNKMFNFKGAWFFQLKQNSVGRYKLLEISPRIPGTMGLSRNQGINFPMLTLFTFWGYDVSIIDNGYPIILDRAFYSCYEIGIEYNHVYIDFDDTIIVDGKVNELVMRFLYQCVNKNKTIHLLSKHTTDIYKDLERFKISKTIFDEIVVLNENQQKFAFINHTDSIFVDDSFVERKAVKLQLGIPVLDIDMIECLLDWRF